VGVGIAGVGIAGASQYTHAKISIWKGQYKTELRIYYEHMNNTHRCHSKNKNVRALSGHVSGHMTGHMARTENSL